MAERKALFEERGEVEARKEQDGLRDEAGVVATVGSKVVKANGV